MVLLVLAADFAVAEVDDRVDYEVEGDDAAAGFAHGHGTLDWVCVSIPHPYHYIHLVKSHKLTLPPTRLDTLNRAHQKVRLLVDILIHFTSIRTDQACDICMVHQVAFRVFEVPFEDEADATEELLVRFDGKVVGGAWHC